MPRNPLTLVLLKTQIKNHPTYGETSFTNFKNFTTHSMCSHNENTSKEKVKKGQLIEGFRLLYAHSIYIII